MKKTKTEKINPCPKCGCEANFITSLGDYIEKFGINQIVFEFGYCLKCGIVNSKIIDGMSKDDFYKFLKETKLDRFKRIGIHVFNGDKEPIETINNLKKEKVLI